MALSDFPRRPIPMLPKLGPRATPEEMARAYMTMSAALYDGWSKQEQRQAESDATLVVVDLTARRAEAAVHALTSEELPKLRDAIDRLTARLNGQEITRAVTPSAGDIAKSVAHEVREQLEQAVEEVTGRHQVVDLPPPPPVLESERIRRVATSVVDEGELRSVREEKKRRLDRRDNILTGVVVGLVLLVAGYAWGRLTPQPVGTPLPPAALHP